MPIFQTAFQLIATYGSKFYELLRSIKVFATSSCNLQQYSLLLLPVASHLLICSWDSTVAVYRDMSKFPLDVHSSNCIF